MIASGDAVWRPQDPTRATLAPKINREDARLDWGEPAVDLERRVRAMAPSPGAFTLIDGEPLRILSATTRADDTPGPPGTVRPQERGVEIATGAGWLVPTSLQRAGGRAMPTAAFLRGRPIADGTRLL